MLKSEMVLKIEQLNEQLDTTNLLISKQKNTISELRDKQSQHNKLKNHVDNAKVAITALIGVNCTEAREWEINRHSICEQHHREGTEMPEPPVLTSLYKSLAHIESILCRPIEETAKRGPFDRY